MTVDAEEHRRGLRDLTHPNQVFATLQEVVQMDGQFTEDRVLLEVGCAADERGDSRLTTASGARL